MDRLRLRIPAASQPSRAIKPSPSAAPDQRPPALVIPLKAHGRTRAELQLWGDLEGSNLERRLATSTIQAAWNSWAALVADRALLERRLQTVVASYREAVETEETRLRQRKLDALSEFAGGAGHELNNPLAVIFGRAQLVLARTKDSETIRSLRIILNQAGRAHRILRDLMFVARAPSPRRRACRPSELLADPVCVTFKPSAPSEGFAFSVKWMTHCRRPGPIPRHCGISPRSCSGTPSRRRPPAVGFWSAPRCKGTSCSGRSATRGRGLATRKRSTFLTRSSAGAKPAVGWDSVCRGPPGSSSLPAASCDGPQTQPTEPSFRCISPSTAPPDLGRARSPLASTCDSRRRALAQKLGN